MHSVSNLILLGTLACGVFGQTTLDLFAGNSGGQQYDGSIVSADCSETTIALVCTAGTYGAGTGFSGTCDGQLTGTATYTGSTGFEVSTAVNTDGVKVTLSESCAISGTTQAVCSVSASASADGQSTAVSTVVTLTGNQIPFQQIPITAGASMLPASSTCTKGNPAPTLAADLYKVVVVPAAALMAGAAFL